MKETTLQAGESLDLDFLIGHKIVKVDSWDGDDTIVLDNGKIYTVTPNEGCGGCGNGWSEVTGLDSLPTDNMITNVELVDGKYEDEYKLFVYFHDEAFEIDVDDGWGNGYYGGGFYVTVSEKEEV